MTASLHSAYKGLAKQRGQIRKVNGAQPGDPAKGVAAILAAMVAEAPPLGLVLGPDALEFATTALDAWRAELDALAETTCGTDFTAA